MKLLVTGVSGFVGRILIKELIVREYNITVASRFDHLIAGCRTVNIGSIGQQTNWLPILNDVYAIIHLAARVHVMNDTSVDPLAEFRKVNVEGTLNLARQAANAGVKRFIFVSSVKVNGEQTEAGKSFNENSVPDPQDAYGLSKLEAEQGLLKLAQETGMEVVIIRPPLVYGVGVKANFASMMRAVRRGIPLPLGAIHNKRSFVYVGNLISLIMCCVDHPAAANQVFMISDGHDLSTTQLLRSCAEALGVKARLLPVPQKILELGATLLGKHDVVQRLCDNLQVDITKARTMLGWTPPFSVADGLKATAVGLLNTDK